MAKATEEPASEKPRIGRPPGAPEDRRTKMLRVLTTESERKKLDRAAKAAGLDVSSWVRTVALKAAEQGGEAAPSAAPKKKSRSG